MRKERVVYVVVQGNCIVPTGVHQGVCKCVNRKIGNRKIAKWKNGRGKPIATTTNYKDIMK